MDRAARRALDGPLAVDMTGRRIGHWTVQKQSWSRRARAQWLCQCTCGAERVFAGTTLRAMPRRGIEPCRTCGAGRVAVAS